MSVLHIFLETMFHRRYSAGPHRADLWQSDGRLATNVPERLCFRSQRGAYCADASVPDSRMGVISSRNGAALALLLSVFAVSLGAAALFAALRSDDGVTPGRLVQTRLVPSDGEPMLFALDGFYASTGEDGKLRALYAFPPGYFGHERGCQVEWRPFETAADLERPGLFVDPCGGSKFDRSGERVFGPAERGLDEFRTEPGIEGVIVDTGVLFCGAPARVRSAAPDGLTLTPAPTSTVDGDREECDRVDAKP
jgi:hypothetical protein